MPIRLLSPEVASQIAAGEVVERPASVVKELAENALDAGARNLTITIHEAGRRLIEVADDGAGIPADELPLAVERHATSKLRSAHDLFSIATLGFRGEALASIGSVSRMTITSRPANAAAGARVRVEAGIASPVEPVGAPQGTVVRVEDLFYNVPARLKFLKQDMTERRAVDGLVSRYALAYPQVRFRFVSDSSPVLQTAGDGDRRAILAALYGVEVARQLVEVLAEEETSDGGILRLTGFISPPALTRSNRKDITFFINGRWISDTPLSQALLQAYHTLLMVGRYPLTALSLEMPAEDVDVNVHPAKAEVRFKNQDRIFSFVQRAARRALLAHAPVPSLAPPQNLWGGPPEAPAFSHNETRPAFSTPSQPALDWQIAHSEPPTSAPESSLNAVIPAPDFPDPSFSPNQPIRSAIPEPAAPAIPLLRLVGQVGGTYLIAEGPDGLYLIDQHAAHERVLFEKLMAQRDQRTLASQALLTPLVVQLPPAQASLLTGQLDALNRFGFDVSSFGPNTFQVRAMPALFGNADPQSALRALVEDFEEDEAPLQAELEAKIAGRVCKRLAVKGGQPLSPEEQKALLASLESCISPRTCPHGRPTMIHLSVDTLERQFGRRGAR